MRLFLELAHAREDRGGAAEHGEDVAHEVDAAAGELLRGREGHDALGVGGEHDDRREDIDDGRAEDRAAEPMKRRE